jgi:predicted secreted protein
MHGTRVIPSHPIVLRAALALGLGLLLGVAPAAQAQSSAASPSSAAQPESRSSREPRMSLQASASASVMQDTVRITLAAQIEAPNQAEAGRRLAAAIDEAVKRASGTQGVQVSSGSFGVWPNTSDKGKITHWSGHGEIVLESRDFAAASALASQLSDKVAISNISFLLSRQEREAQEHKLLDQAAQAFRDRAQAAAKAFGFSGYRLVRLELGGSGAAAPMPRGAVMAMAKAGSAPMADVPLEAGEVTVTIAVNGTIALQ